MVLVRASPGAGRHDEARRHNAHERRPVRYLYTLGPPIVPPKTVKAGNLYRAQRVEAAIDLLLTCDTIRDARDKTQERLTASGEVLA